MRAVRLVTSGQPLEFREIDVPAVGAGEVLVRTAAAGICHSDAHYRGGLVPQERLPLTPGHEVAGVVEEIGEGVSLAVGDRVCLHYLVTCGTCSYCTTGNEQFCASAQMLGKDRDGGYGEYVCVPERNAFLVPEAVPMTWAAVLMCSSSTSLHALKKARLAPGESVAVFGVGGLGMSALQLAFALGASRVFAVDLDPDRLALAEKFGAEAVHAAIGDPVAEIRRRTDGRGVDVATELIGLPLTMHQALTCLAPKGRAAVAGITTDSLAVDTYRELVATEAELIGVSDHLATEIPELLDHVQAGRLDLSHVITETVPRDADAINGVLDRLVAFGAGVRAVIEG